MSNKQYSYSQLDTYCQCPFKYKLKYVDKLRSEGSGIALDFGTAVHQAEEAIAGYILAGQPINYITIKNDFITKMFKIKDTFPEEFYLPDKSGRSYLEKAYLYVEKAIYYLENYLAAHPTYKLLASEQPFDNIDIDGKLFRGAIDRIFYDTLTSTYILEDIKTYSVLMDTDKLATPLQFVVYVSAAKLIWHCKESQISCQYYLPLCESAVQAAGTAGFINRGHKKLDKSFAAIFAEEFAPKPSPLCHWCEYSMTNPNITEECKYACPYFSHWTKEHKDFTFENKWEGIENHSQILENFHKKYNAESV